MIIQDLGFRMFDFGFCNWAFNNLDLRYSQPSSGRPEHPKSKIKTNPKSKFRNSKSKTNISLLSLYKTDRS
jgi:hypothetical protein